MMTFKTDQLSSFFFADISTTRTLLHVFYHEYNLEMVS